ncbi:hypothetical protein CCMSSC00406_0008242 [Pleurotus cornucopiae]|uniref:Uncharacterized protein n=1 Tax=Pleurotus cornucopiae TaxID=5321 RepID=A0ACB7INW0_PLECO|nr:hypothetical protein CCMSSC00406_0008242 [Pleurotus cornucopiae]
MHDDLGGSVPNGRVDFEGDPFSIPEAPNTHDIIDVGPTRWSEDDFDQIWAGSGAKWKDMPCIERVRLLNATIGIIEAKEFVQTVLDSGATDHFITNRDSFITYEAVPPFQGSGSKKGSRFTIVGKGRASKTFIVDGQERTITFDALHTPDVSSDLISVSQLDGKGLTILFSKGLGRVYDADDKLILTATKRSGLYVFDVKQSPIANATRSLDKPVNMDTWHRRYGHAGVDRIRQSFTKELVDGGNIEGPSSGEQCVPCIHGNGVRRPFDAVVVPTMEPLAQVHTDLCGPMRVQGRGGFVYSMPIVNDGTSFTKQFYLKDKSADTTLKAIDNYRTETERQTGKKLKVVRIDGGGESDNALWHTWGEKHGIIIEITPAHSSTANGVAERRHRSIYSRVRTILFESKMPPSLWCWVAEYVVHTDNLLPSSRHPGTIPAESFRGKRQSVSHLRPFGCRAFAKIVDGKPGKLDDQVVEGRMVGYDERGVYWLYLPDGRIVTIDDNIDLDLIPSDDETVVLVDHDQDKRPASPDPAPPEILPDVVVPKRRARKQPAVPLEPVRRSSRVVPSKVNDKPKAKMTLAETNPFKFLPESVNYMDTSDNIALTAVSFPPVPSSYAEAMKDPGRWQPPMDEELARMEAFEVFGPACDPPAGATVLGVMWVYAHKFNGLGEIVGEKARLVVQGQHQVEGRDFYKKYAGVMRLESLRMLLAVWVMLGFYIWQVDFKSAYLNAKMEEELYVRLPKGFRGSNTHTIIVPLWQSLYGAVQAGNNWWRELDASYTDLKYVRSEADQCVRSRKDAKGETHTGTYTDDIAGGSSSLEEAERAKRELGEKYAIKVTDEVEFSLGMRLEHDREKGTATLSMRGYLERLLERHSFSDIKPKSTPFALGTRLSKDGALSMQAQSDFMADKPYDVIVGGLQFAVGAMRPDLTFSVNVLSRYSRNPGPTHWKALLHVLGYVKGTLDIGITYSRDTKDGMIPIIYVDTDLGMEKDTGCSTMGIITKMAGAPTFWMSKRQDAVSLSTVEAEYDLPMHILNNNQGALSICENPEFHAHTKHIDLRHHRIRELVNPGARGVRQLSVDYIPGKENPADILTKGLSTRTHAKQIKLMGLSRHVA